MLKKIKNLVKDYDKVREVDDLIYNTVREQIYDSKINEGMAIAQTSLLSLIVNEDWWSFYDSFGTPSDPSKPLAWDNGFIPDKIQDTINNKESVNVRSKKILNLYQTCLKARE